MNPPQPPPAPPHDEESLIPAEEDDPIVGFRQMRRDTSVAHRWDALNQRSAQLARYLFKQVTSYMRLLRSLFRLGTALFLLIHILRERGTPQAILLVAKKSFLAVYAYAAFCYSRFRVTFAALKEIICIRGSHRPDDRTLSGAPYPTPPMS
jgi:hypothetical protein